MLLLGLFVFSLIPFDSYQTTNLYSAARRVELDIRYAQDYARTTDANCGVNFVANGTYTVYSPDTATPITSPYTQASMTKFIGEDFSNTFIVNDVQFEFDPQGRPILGGGESVQIGDGTSTVTLTVTPSTGFVVSE